MDCEDNLNLIATVASIESANGSSSEKLSLLPNRVTPLLAEQNLNLMSTITTSDAIRGKNNDNLIRASNRITRNSSKKVNHKKVNSSEMNHDNVQPSNSTGERNHNKDKASEMNHDKDLPLSANITDIHVVHYILQLMCNMETQQLVGHVTLFKCSNLLPCQHCTVKSTQKTKFSSGDNICTADKMKDDLEHAGSERICTVKNESLTQVNEPDPQVENYLHISDDLDCTVNEKKGNSEHTSFERYKNIMDGIFESEDVINEPEANIEHIVTEHNYIVLGNWLSERNIMSNDRVLHGPVKTEPVLAVPDGSSSMTVRPENETSINNKITESRQATSVSDDSVSSCTENKQTTLKANEVTDFKMLLDCCDIEVDYIEELDLPINILKTVRNQCDKVSYDRLKEYIIPRGCLMWEYGHHCLSVWKKGVKCGTSFPDVIRIHYRTTPSGQSLKWTQDQDNKWCVFTHGHWINNRSLFPAQDAPEAMATWQAEIEVKGDLTVVMGGDKQETTSCGQKKGWKKEYFYTRMEMPCSTLCLAIGYWQRMDILYKDSTINTQRHYEPRMIIKSYRLIGPVTILSRAHKEIQSYLPVCFKEVSKLLGPNPFSRLDVLVVPPCFDSLGMASPNVMFISQSLLAGDQSMFVRIAHEVCHSWFGLSIGPKDWTEEWLSEGFCTYMEDIIHINVKQAMNLFSSTQASEEKELRNYLKYKTLKNELDTTDSDLQMLRPVKDMIESGYVRDGMNSDKRFLQVHYLKGYFLLCYLESFLATDKFLRALHAYVIRFHKELVSSKDTISFLFSVLPELREQGLTEDSIYHDWLDNPGMPEVLKNYRISEDNLQFNHVKQQVSMLKKLWRKNKGRKKNISADFEGEKLSPIQLAVLLEMLLEERRIPAAILLLLREKYDLTSKNAEVQHRWCELVIKHKVQTHYSDVENFLLHHQAMGVYLYGELVLSGCKKQRKLAEKCFNLLETHMEPDPYTTVKAMIYGESQGSFVVGDNVVYRNDDKNSCDEVYNEAEMYVATVGNLQQAPKVTASNIQTKMTRSRPKENSCSVMEPFAEKITPVKTPVVHDSKLPHSHQSGSMHLSNSPKPHKRTDDEKEEQDLKNFCDHSHRIKNPSECEQCSNENKVTQHMVQQRKLRKCLMVCCNELQDVIPNLSNEEQAPRITVLTEAIKCIHFLTEENQRLSNQKAALFSRQLELLQTIDNLQESNSK